MRNDFGEKVAGFILFCLLLLGAAMIAYCGQGIGVEYGNPYLKHHYRLAPGTAVVLLNDLDLTPGVVRTTSRKAICEGGSTDQFRHTTELVKNKAYALYGIDKHSPVGFFGMESPKPPLYEIDHLISLELGGADELENLWPQPYYMHPGAREKDTVENWLHKQICTGKMEPQEAQRSIATDWYAVYVEMNKLPSGTSGAN